MISFPLSVFMVRNIKDGITSIALTITGGKGNVDVVVVARKPGVKLRAFDILQHQPFHDRCERRVRLSLGDDNRRKDQ